MSVLYRPVLIESAEQADALPTGTVALDLDTDGTPGEVSRKQSDGRWGGVGDSGEPYSARLMAGDHALVPIEAEEETTGALVNRAGEIRWEESTRYVTPWEDA